MKFKLLLIVALCHGSILAQESSSESPYKHTLGSYTNYFAKEYGVTCAISKEFNDLNQYFALWKISKDKDKHSGGAYGPLIQSKDQQCLVMYPALAFPTFRPEVGHNPQNQIMSEIRTALGLYYMPRHPLNQDSVITEFNDYVTIISGQKAHEMFNADLIYLYNIPLEEPYDGKYNYCTGLVISKKGRPSLLLKLFFTPKGKSDECQYIQMLSKQLWYDENFKPAN